MWKAPNRPNNKITQTFNDRPVKIYKLIDTAENGYMPEPKPVCIGEYPCEMRSVGVRRFYEARQNQVEIEAVCRVPIGGLPITSKDLCKVGEEFYRIDQVQAVDVYPPSFDLSLVRYDREGLKNALV